MTEEGKEQKDSSVVGKVNNIATKGRDLQRTYKAIRTGRTMLAGAEGAGALLSNPAGWAILAIGFVLVITVLVLFGGVSGVRGGNLAPECAGITAPSLTVAAGNTITLTVSGCTTDVTYAWESPSIGTLSNTNSAAVTYTAPTTVTASTKTTLTVNVCSSQSTDACTAYSVDITIVPVSLYTCPIQYCSPKKCGSDETPVPGDTCPDKRYCCKPASSGKCDVVCWAEKLSGSLSKPNTCTNYIARSLRIANNGYVAKTGNGNCQGWGSPYLCTYLVWDAYKLAGKRGPASPSTCYQIQQWRNLGNGYSIQRNNLRGAKPGDALFWTGVNDRYAKDCGSYGFTHHTDMIYTIKIYDYDKGIGRMTTLDANAPMRKANYSIKNWFTTGPWSFTGFWLGRAP